MLGHPGKGQEGGDASYASHILSPGGQENRGRVCDTSVRSA
jgi:hypothetical protein